MRIHADHQTYRKKPYVVRWYEGTRQRNKFFATAAARDDFIEQLKQTAKRQDPTLPALAPYQLIRLQQAVAIDPDADPVEVFQFWKAEKAKIAKLGDRYLRDAAAAYLQSMERVGRNHRIAFAYWMNETQRQQDRAREQREFEMQEAIRHEPIRLREKAEGGDVNAMVELWEAYRHGFKRGFSKDPERQLYWMTKAAEAGHSESIRQLAFAYQSGEIVEKNLTTAFYWFSKGAEAGRSWSMWEVAHYYYLGIQPVEQNFEGSLYWYGQACKDDRGYAQLYVTKWDSGLKGIWTKRMNFTATHHPKTNGGQLND